MTSLKNIIEKTLRIGYDVVLVSEPIVILILKRENSILSSSKKGEGVEKFCVCITIVKPTYSGFKFPNILPF